MIIEVWAALTTGSLALLSDAGHMLTDLSGLILAYIALRLASRPATKDASYGFQRYEVLAAAINGMLLVGIASFIVYRAVVRLQEPLHELNTIVVLLVATAGLLINLFAAWFLHNDAKDNINAEGAWWNVIGDAVASAGVVVAILLVHFTGNTSWDTYVSFVVAAIILWGGIGLLRKTGAILLESVPPHIDPVDLRNQVERLTGVKNIHDLHIWTITPGQHALTMHATIATDAVDSWHEVTKEIEGLLADRWNLTHCTIQLEPEGIDPESDHFDPI